MGRAPTPGRQTCRVDALALDQLLTEMVKQRRP